MILLIVLALLSAYLVGTSFLPPNMTKLNLGIILFLITTVVSFIQLKLWGVLFLIGMFVVTIILFLGKFSRAKTKIFRNADVVVAKKVYLNDQAKHDKKDIK
jgi:membrane protein implicated in regulation of membrane protease activity